MSISDNWGTVKEASRHYGVTRAYIHRLIKKGRLGECRQHEALWLIPYPFPAIVIEKNITKEQDKNG